MTRSPCSAAIWSIQVLHSFKRFFHSCWFVKHFFVNTKWILCFSSTCTSWSFAAEIAEAHSDGLRDEINTAKEFRKKSSQVSASAIMYNKLHTANRAAVQNTKRDSAPSKFTAACLNGHQKQITIYTRVQGWCLGTSKLSVLCNAGL